MHIRAVHSVVFAAIAGISLSVRAGQVRAVASEADKTEEWTEAYTDLQAAIAAAGENGTVLLRDGVYSISATLQLTAAGQTLSGESRDGTILDGGKSVRILSTAGFATPAFRHLTFRNGNGGDQAGALYIPEGAGAFCIEDCVFADNQAGQCGGAVYSQKNDSGQVKDCLFYGNAVTSTVNGSNQGGGAYYSSHAYESVNKYTTLSGCVFSNNCASGGAPLGGAVLFAHAGRISDCTFVTNVAEVTAGGSSRGGDICAGSGSRISNSVFNGFCKASYGMAIRLGGVSEISNCDFGGLRPSGSFGVVYIGNDTSVLGCLFTDITAGDLIMQESTSKGLVRNCRVTGNSAASFTRCHSAKGLRVEHCTFADNGSMKAGGDSGNYGETAYVNCVFQGAGPKVTGSGKYGVFVTNSIVPYVTGGTEDGGLILTTDPGFKSIAHGDFRLAAGSLGIDAGLDLGWQTSASDLNGDARFVGTAPDLGCYERQSGEVDPFYGIRVVATEEERKGEWADAYVGIQPAVDAATSGDTVLVKNGRYALTAPVTLLNKGVVLRGESRDGSVLDGQGACRCLDVKIQSGTVASPTFENLTLTNGFAGTSAAYENHYGSGGAAWLSCDSTTGRITLRNCRVTGSRTVLASGANVDMGCGGGVFANHYCTLENCLVDNNCASNGCGGGIRLVGIGSSPDQAGAIVSGCVISNNLSCGSGGANGSGAHGAGIYAKDNAARIADTVFTGNEARADASTAYGGALLLNGIKAEVFNCQFVANTSSNYGGAIDLNQAFQTVSVCSCAFTRNAGGYGVVYAGNGNNLFDSCAFTNNVNAPYFTTGTMPAFRNSLFADNKGNAGFYVNSGSGALFAESCTIAGNGTGIGVNSGSPTVGLLNCIVSGNAKDFDCKAAASGSSFALTNCLVGACPAVTCDAKDCIIGKSPRFVSAAAGDYSIRPTSPCREHALERDWMAGATDIVGAPRIVGATGKPRAEDPTAMPDIGCYECLLQSQGLMLYIR